MGRKSGTKIRCTCCVCGTVEMGGSPYYYRCANCRDCGYMRAPTGRFADLIGRQAASGLVQVEIKAGRLPHPSTLTCADCNGPASEYEHRDYNKPLSVEPICRSCNHRRGPAIPWPGSLQRSVELGYVPYARRHRASQLFAALGVKSAALDQMPKRLTLDHWRALLPELPANA